jgi:hypothetical protein
MKRVLFVFTLVSCLLISQSHAILFEYPPDWRGDDGTTYQTWSFTTSELTPDVSENENGTASIEFTGEFFTDYLWLEFDPLYPEQEGVWMYETEMWITIPNFQVPNPYKEIVLEIIYSDKDGYAPTILAMPEDDLNSYSVMSLIEDAPLDENSTECADYRRAVYSITLEPNPTFETIVIKPRFYTLYVDKLTIDTICVPEPASLSILALGGLFLLKRRK